ncbi:ammonia channel protein [Paenibacillus darwinianus]|uniref:Ammonium transporter n=1 Tax=Paenibacillus darwinianus TaxID=1380763 RepID=A0A9W5W7N7_9BACL|nr:ammonia channel protein [Paenibacillus darwinianus]EXX91102.1 ammonia channel protein [Paenibacillus darwinianus]EXX91956.1 ammonia channel protein [Paenibacillus darwinianus]
MNRSKRLLSILCLTALSLSALPATVFAEGDAVLPDTGDTTWLLVSTVLVMFMFMPGLALFYGGLVSQRNILSTIMHSLSAFLIVTVVWVLWGYSLAFGPNEAGGLIGGLAYAGFRGVGLEVKDGLTIPHLLFALYQGMFAAITTALISGGVAERIRFSVWIVFSALWVTLVYAPMAHWVWNGGWLSKLGGLDFAGGTVVHILSGVSALTAAVVIGKRRTYPHQTQPPHNLIFFLIGGMSLWFGWFGFNAGSALASGGLASLAVGTTQVAACAGGLMWLLVETIRGKKPTMVGGVTGVIAGLIAITPAAGFVTIPSALVIGGLASVFCYWGLHVLKARLQYDDSLDVFGLHGIGGMWGAIATGIFATTGVNSAGANGLLYGNPMQVVTQTIDVAVAVLFAACGTYVILKVIGLFTPLRVTDEQELTGLDVSLHGEVAYHTVETMGNQTVAAHHAPSSAGGMSAQPGIKSV